MAEERMLPQQNKKWQRNNERPCCLQQKEHGEDNEANNETLLAHMQWCHDMPTKTLWLCNTKEEQWKRRRHGCATPKKNRRHKDRWTVKSFDGVASWVKCFGCATLKKNSRNKDIAAVQRVKEEQQMNMRLVDSELLEGLAAWWMMALKAYVWKEDSIVGQDGIRAKINSRSGSLEW